MAGRSHVSTHGGSAHSSKPDDNSRADIFCNCCSAKLSSILNVIMKKTCPSCQRVVCPACLVFTLKIPRALCVCKRCDRLSSVNFEPRHLMRMRGKELHDILIALNIPYTDGSEKSELVELIVRHRGASVHRGWRPSHPPEPPTMQSTAGLRSMLDVSGEDPPVSSHLRERSNSLEVILDTSNFGDAASGPPLSPVTDNIKDVVAAAAAAVVATLEDIESEEAIQSLSIRELKSILLRNSVDYKGCCEKWELEARVLELWRSTRRTTADIDDVSEEDLCKICMNAPMDCVLLECGHVATCTSCGRKMNECPICRQFVVRVVHIFRA